MERPAQWSLCKTLLCFSLLHQDFFIVLILCNVFYLSLKSSLNQTLSGAKQSWTYFTITQPSLRPGPCPAENWTITNWTIGQRRFDSHWRAFRQMWPELNWVLSPHQIHVSYKKTWRLLQNRNHLFEMIHVRTGSSDHLQIRLHLPVVTASFKTPRNR